MSTVELGSGREQRHPVHLMLNEAEILLMISLYEDRIAKEKSKLQKVTDAFYDNNLKKRLKIDEINDRLRILNNLWDEIRTQACW